MSTTLEDLHNEDEPILDPVDPTENPANPENPESLTENPTGDSDPEESAPGIEQFLAQYGIQGGIVTITDDSGTNPEQKHFNDLSSEEQFNILFDLAQSGLPSVEERFGLDPDEIGLINYVRDSGKTVNEAINDIAMNRLSQLQAMQESNSLDYTNMSDEGVTAKWLRESNPDATDEEIAEELERAKSGKFFEKNAESYKKQFIARQQAELERSRAEQEHQMMMELENDRAQIATEVAGIDNLFGFEISKEDKNAVLSMLLEVNGNGDSKFMEEVFSDPKRLFKAAWLYKNAEGYFEKLETYYKKEIANSYSKGRREAIEGMPSNPVNTTSPRKATSNQTSINTNVKTIADLHED
jgi:hypothetical protein